MRTVCIAKWGSDQGLAIINKLSHLYSAIVWENDLLGLLSPPYNHTQGRGDLEKLIEVIGPNPVISKSAFHTSQQIGYCFYTYCCSGFCNRITS